MGFVKSSLILGAIEKFEDKLEEQRTVAREKSRQQDEEWACQMRVAYTGGRTIKHRETMLGMDREGKLLYRVFQGLLGKGGKAAVKDADGQTVAVIRDVKIKPPGVKDALGVIIGGEPFGFVYRTKATLLNGYKHDFSYHFDPVGLDLVKPKNPFDYSREIQDASGSVVAVVSVSSLIEGERYRLNYNDARNGLLYLTLLLAEKVSVADL